VDGTDACLNNGNSIADCLSAEHGGGWLNSIEILGHLLSSYHMTGNTKFYDSNVYLRDTERYSVVAMANDNDYTISNPSLQNHSDHELAMLAYSTLIRYEPDATWRAYWLSSLKYLYDEERGERNPLWAAVYSVAGASDAEAVNARRTLREMPDDTREWGIDNSTRTDANGNGNDRFGDPQWDRVFPYDEIRTMWWNGNPFSATEGGSGAGVTSPTAWLLAYYMNIYGGVIK